MIQEKCEMIRESDRRIRERSGDQGVWCEDLVAW
jgi:hypothetical protein